MRITQNLAILGVSVNRATFVADGPSATLSLEVVTDPNHAITGLGHVYQGDMAVAHCIIARALATGILPDGYFCQPCRCRDGSVRITYGCAIRDIEEVKAALEAAANATGIMISA